MQVWVLVFLMVARAVFAEKTLCDDCGMAAFTCRDSGVSGCCADVIGRLDMKFEQDPRPGSGVVSCEFSLRGRYPHQLLRPDALRHGDLIHTYRFPDACRM